MKSTLTLIILIGLSAVGPCLGADVYVLPAVADLQPGFNGSLWATEVRVIKLDPAADVTVRRLWVCVPDGGFLDDPGTAPTWRLPPVEQEDGVRFWPLSGSGLLKGTSSTVGAAAIEVEGGGVVIQAYVADISLGGFIESGDVNLIWGLGQGYSPFKSPLEGLSSIPWMQVIYANEDTMSPHTCRPAYRNDIGVVNPNPEPLSLDVHVVFFDSPAQPENDNFHMDLPPYGWKQVAYKATREADEVLPTPPFGPTWVCPAGGIANLTPDSNAPYYAYASVVYTPPDPQLPQFSDPMFVPARPGAIPSAFEQAQSATAEGPRP